MWSSSSSLDFDCSEDCGICSHGEHTLVLFSFCVESTKLALRLRFVRVFEAETTCANNVAIIWIRIANGEELRT